MLYKPKYCCNCGDKIQRTDWKIFSSRKFCELCETEYKFEEILPKAAVFLLIVFGVWGFGSLFFRSGESVVVKENFKTGESRNNAKRSVKSDGLQSGELNKQNSSAADSGQKISEEPTLPSEISTERDSPTAKSAADPQKNPVSAVYFCGAETKKGTPCSRRVKGGGRCWQHKGRDAMLPAKDLKIQE